MHLSWFLLALTFLTLTGKCFAITCHKCDSVTLPDCATSLDNETLPTVECKNDYSCASSIVDSVTYRGCSSNTPRGPTYYKTCSENLCNKGVYPPGRLKCHQCGGNACIPTPSTKPRPCINFVEDDKCYTEVIDEIDTYRGCYSDTSRSRSDLTVYCETNGCNNLPGVETLTCSKCDSHEARGCKMDLFEINNQSCVIANNTSCSGLSLLGHEKPSCFWYTNLDHVIRGCTFESNIFSFDNENFYTCFTSLCNKKCLPQQKCVVCDSRTNKKCISDPESLALTTCEGAETSSCNSCELPDGSVQRGCGVPSKSTSNAHCNECQGEGCNKFNFTKCYKCSSDDSPNCGQWVNPDIVDVENCEITGAACVMAVLLNGETLRGCYSSQLTCNRTLPWCHTCSGNLCNDGVYPPRRLQCHHCDGREKCSNISDSSTILPCAKYEEDDVCFEFLSGRNNMVRGCKSNYDLFHECLLSAQNGTSCRTCSESGCNNLPAKRKATLLCHKCSRTQPECSWFQSNDTLEVCQNEVKFMARESCFTRQFSDGSISRGCSLDEQNAMKVSEEFLESTCTADGCNRRNQFPQKCVVCRGNVQQNGSCSSADGNLKGILCVNNESLSYDQRGCYTKLEGDSIERGCASSLSTTDLQECQQNIKKDCHYCQGNECNSFRNLTLVIVKNSSSRVVSQSLVGLNFMIFMFILYLTLQ